MRFLYVLITLIFSCNALATQNYFTNVFRPYPGGCATNVQIADFFPTRVVVIAEGPIQLLTRLGEEHEVIVTVQRRLCANSNRAIIEVLYEVVDDNDGLADIILLPRHRALVEDTEYNLRAVYEPNGYVGSAALTFITEGVGAWLTLDTWSLYSPSYGQEREMLPSEYNGAFQLQIISIRAPGQDKVWVVDMPVLDDSNRPTRMALNGRFSGTWVIHGVEDQGFLIAFEELADAINPFVFFSWYTYDTNHDLIWLTGGDVFEIGDTSVTFDIVYVTNGNFMGSKRADRTTIGSVTLTGINCNNLRMIYDLTELGMGSGTRKLERLFELETQGYTCRDTESRIMSLQAGGGLE